MLSLLNKIHCYIFSGRPRTAWTSRTTGGNGNAALLDRHFLFFFFFFCFLFCFVFCNYTNFEIDTSSYIVV